MRDLNYLLGCWGCYLLLYWYLVRGSVMSLFKYGWYIVCYLLFDDCIKNYLVKKYISIKNYINKKYVKY